MRKHNHRIFIAVAVAGACIAAVTAVGTAVAAPLGCGDLHNAFGPFDYRTVSPENRNVVESHHFTPKVEMLRTGESGYIGGDLDYTLRAMPNHARALMAVAKLSMKTHSDNLQGASYSAECYFDRAIRFQPTDPMPHMIYAIYLKDHKRPAEVKEQLAEAERLRGDPVDFDFDYNLGLLYLGVGELDKASLAGRRAYALGAPWPALKTRLKAAGKWSDEPPPPKDVAVKADDPAAAPSSAPQ